MEARWALMSDQPVVLAVASYPSWAAAEKDFGSLWAPRHRRGLEELAAAVVEKGTNGELQIDRLHNTAIQPVWGVVLLGAAVTVIAAPLGITILASGVETSAEWAAAAAVVSRFWQNIPRELLRTMGNLLEAGQAGLVVVAMDRGGEDIGAALSSATTKVVTDYGWGDLAAVFSESLGRA